jgi:DNA-binding CsgD family transcriptional regulator
LEFVGGVLAAQQIHSPSPSTRLAQARLVRDGAARDQNHGKAGMQNMTIDRAAIWLTDTILGDDGPDLEQTLKAIAANIGVLHIAYVPLRSQKSEDANLLSAICTYPFAWQARYFKKQYTRIDPVIARGREAVLPFDWDELPKDDLATRAFFDDAADHDVGQNGLSIPVRNRKGVRSLVCFTSNHSKRDWAEYKSRNIIKLQPMAVLIDSAAGINFKLTPEPVELSKREEECLIWAARGKTYHDIAGILNLSFASVKTYLDTARHKLSCINLTHAVAVAIATGVIPAKALRQPC